VLSCVLIGCQDYFFDRDTEQTDIAEIQYIQKVTVHLQKVLEVMSMSVYIGLNPFNFIRKHFLQICL
jgi:hypothetical protein